MAKVDKNQFRRIFYELIYEYLYECNLIYFGNSRPVPINQIAKRKGKRYLGIDIETLKPCIGVIESMDGCDVYDLDLLQRAFRTDERGLFVAMPHTFSKFYLDEKSVLNDLVARYYSSTYKDNPLLNLIRPASECILCSSSEKDRVKVSRDTAYIYATVAGKYYHQGLISMPLNLCEIVFEIEQFIKGLDQRIMRYQDRLEVASKYKREKKYDKAIEIYKKVDSLDLGFDVYHDLLVCYRKLKDTENERAIAVLAHEKFPDNVEYHKAYLKVSGEMPAPEIIECNHSFNIQDPKGDQYEREILKLKEFTFSKDDHPFYELFFSDELSERKRRSEDKKYQEYLKNIRMIQYDFYSRLKEAEQCEALGDMTNAVAIYESLIADKCYREKPYERLAIIYGKMKLDNDLRRIVNFTIEHFSDLQKRQYEYVCKLAEKYDALNILNEMISSKGVVKYWFGDIVLYKEYSIIENFKKRLAKLK